MLIFCCIYITDNDKETEHYDHEKDTRKARSMFTPDIFTEVPNFTADNSSGDETLTASGEYEIILSK